MCTVDSSSIMSHLKNYVYVTVVYQKDLLSDFDRNRVNQLCWY